MDNRSLRRPAGREWLDVAALLAIAFRAYLWSSLKNCVKFLIGRKTYYNDRDLFFRQYLFNLFGYRPIRNIVSPGLLNEGPGSQALMAMHAISFARASGLTYVHTPIVNVVNADRPMEEWAAAWERAFNLGDGQALFDGRRTHAVNYAYTFPQLHLCFGWKGARGDMLTEAFEAAVPDFKRKYYANKTRVRNDIVTVWVQVRRGEITQFAHPHMWTENSFIAETIRLVRASLERRRLQYRVCICSQGTYDGIGQLASLDNEIHLNVDPIWSLEQAVAADVLIMAKSSFSYVSGLLSDGIVIFESGHFSPLSHWVKRGPDDYFDSDTFELRLDRVIEVRKVR